MTLNEYQEKAMTTCLPASENFSYMMLNLVGEVGEFASKVAKAIRKGKVRVGCVYGDGNDDPIAIADSTLDVIDKESYENIEPELQKEAGDIAWQLAGLCHVMGWNLEDICQQNLDKLASRKQRNVIDGNGDNR